MEAQVSPAIALVKANRLAESHAPLAAVARALMARGARAVVLGCTEIPLGMAAGPPPPFPVVDTVAALADAAIAWARAGAAV
jgi:aspartate racemase